MTTVILAEKPDQGRKLANALKGGKLPKDNHGKIEFTSKLFGPTIVTWGFGHLVGLAMPERYDYINNGFAYESIPFLPHPDQMIYEIQEGKHKQFQIVKQCLEQADEVIIATDCDREGENIAYNIFELCSKSFQKKKMKRLWINSLTDKEILRGFNNLLDAKETKGYYDEASARQISDFLIGMNFSPLFTLKLQDQGIDGVFSLGRVQTPVNTLIVENDLSIQQFVPKPYKTIEAKTDTTPPVTFKNKKEYFDIEEYEKDMAAHQLDEAEFGIILNVEVSEKAQMPPKLFSLGGLQKYANSRWKYPTKKTDSIIQKLYQEGILSYPRTDSELITTNEFGYLKENLGQYKQLLGITAELPNLTPNKRFVDNKKVLEHYAIIPTTETAELNKLSRDEKNIYLAVLERTITMFANPYRYHSTKITLDVKGMEFSAIGNTPIDKGWKGVIGFEEDAKKDEKETTLPKFTIGQQVAVKIITLDKETQPPKRVTEGTLVGKNGLMDRLNLGTPATRTSTVERLVQQKYIEIKNNQVFPTAKGYLLWDLTKNRNLLVGNPDMTAKWEEVLKKVSKGTYTREAFIANIHKFVNETITGLKQVEFKSQYMHSIPRAAPLPSHQIGNFQVIDKGKLYEVIDDSGTRIPIFKNIGGKTLTPKMLEELLLEGRTKEVVKDIESKSGKKFNAILTLDMEAKKMVPIFEDEVFFIGKFKAVNRGGLLQITDPDGEQFEIWKSFGNKELPMTVINQLLLKGRTDNKIKGFTSQNGAEYSAFLGWDSQEKKIVPIFEDEILSIGDFTVTDKDKVFEVTDAFGVKFPIFKNVGGKELTLNHLRQILTEGRTQNVIKGMESKSGKKFDAALSLDLETKRLVPIFVDEVVKIGDFDTIDRGKLIVATGPDGSQYEIWKTFAEKELPMTVIKQLLTNGKTNKKIKGLKGKNGNKYDAFLGIDKETKKIIPIFEDEILTIGAYQVIDKGKVFEITNSNGMTFPIFKNIGGKDLSLKSLKEILIDGKTKNKIKGLKSQTGNKYDAYLGFDNQKQKVIPIFDQESFLIGQYSIIDKGKVFEVSLSDQEPFIIFKEVSSKTITKEILEEILLQGKTSERYDFVAKNKNKFSAFLIFDSENKKVSFSFD